MSRKKTHEEYVAEVAEINPNIEVIGHYNGNKIKILHRCKIDEHEWLVYPSSILRGIGCPVCGAILTANHTRKSHSQYCEELYSINQNIQVIGQYVNARTKILHKCLICGHEWLAVPDSLLSGRGGCPECRKRLNSIRRRKTNEQYAREVSIIDPDIIVIGNYLGAFVPIEHECAKCGNVWKAQPTNILAGHGCNACNSSVGEKKVASYLTRHYVKFVRQHTFEDCRNIHKLPFDFYLPNYNACIEYDGAQHFEPVKGFGGIDKFVSTQKNDSIKNNYCDKTGILLLRIRYDEDIDEKLDAFFAHNNTKLLN